LDWRPWRVPWEADIESVRLPSVSLLLLGLHTIVVPGPWVVIESVEFLQVWEYEKYILQNMVEPVLMKNCEGLQDLSKLQLFTVTATYTQRQSSQCQRDFKSQWRGPALNTDPYFLNKIRPVMQFAFI